MAKGRGKFILSKYKYRYKTLTQGQFAALLFMTAMFNFLCFVLETSSFSRYVDTSKFKPTVLSVFSVLLFSVTAFFAVKYIIQYKYYTRKRDFFMQCIFDVYGCYLSLYLIFDVFLSKMKSPALVSVFFIVLPALILTGISFVYLKNKERIYEKIGDRRRTNAGPVSGILIWAVSSAVMRRFFDSQIIVKYVFALPIGIMLTGVCVFLFLRNFGEFYERRNEV